MYNNTKIILRDCLYIPTFTVNIISVNKIIKSNASVIFKDDKAQILKNNKVLFEALLEENLYSINLENKLVTRDIIKDKILYTGKDLKKRDKAIELIKLWHKRFGHKNIDIICLILGIKRPINF